MKADKQPKSLRKELSLYFWANGFSSVVLSLLELALAFSIQMLLIAFKLVESAQHDSFISSYFGTISLTSVCYLLLSIAFIRFVFESVIAYTNSTIFEESIYLLRTKLIPTILFSPSFKNSKANYYNGTLFAYASLYLSYLLRFSSSLVLSIFMIFFMVLINYKLTLLSLFLILIIGFVTKVASKRIQAWTKNLPSMNQKINAYIEKISKNFMLIQLLKMQTIEEKNLGSQTQAILRHNHRSSLLTSLNVASTSFLGIFIIVAIVFFSQRTFNDSIINVIPFLYFFMRFVQFLSPLVHNFALMSQKKFDYRQANEFYMSPLPISKDKSTETIPTTNTPHIEVKNLSFQYPDTPKKLLSNISFDLKPGESLGINGRSGAGKSTLIHILLNLEQSFHGIVTYDDVPIKDYYEKYKLNIGYVGASSFLFEGTIKDNVLYGNDSLVKDEKILQMFRNLNLMDVASNQGDLEKVIHEDSSNLSMGQKQRICIARALLNSPQLLILDEYTSNLDQETELSIAQLIANIPHPRPTIIAVSHRDAAIAFTQKKIHL